MLLSLARRITVRTLDAVVERGRRSGRGPVRSAAGVLDRARGAVGLHRVPVRSPIPEWSGATPDQPMWGTDRNKLEKWRIDRGIVPAAGAATAAAPPKKPVELYFRRGCTYTRAAKQLLDEREIPYDEIDVTDDETRRSWLVIVTKSKKTPQIFVHGEAIGGYEQLRELDASGELAAKLAQAAADAPKPAAGRIKLPILHPAHSPFESLPAEEWTAGDPDGPELEGEELVSRVRAVLDECRPMIRQDGGDIVLVDVQRDRVTIELSGNCIGCPSAKATLRQGIERRLRSQIPQIRSIASPQLA